MPRTNYQFGGLRWHTPEGTAGLPQPVACTVASAYNTDLLVGDPVKAINDGTVERAGAGTDGIYGVIIAILQYRNSDGVLVRNGRYVPANTTWTAHADRTQVLVAPARGNYFLIQSDDATTLTTMALVRSAKGNNADHIYPANAANNALGLSACILDISTVNTTNTLQWRIHDVLEQPGNDPLQTRATYIVYANVLSNFGGVGSNTGV